MGEGIARISLTGIGCLIASSKPSLALYQAPQCPLLACHQHHLKITIPIKTTKMADEYQWDTIEAYRFTKDIIDNYLQGLFGYYDYFTEVRPFLARATIKHKY
jgi:hypothetical protein